MGKEEKLKFLVIQTAFAGDVILATALVEKLNSKFPQAQIDFVCNQTNESLLRNNPHIKTVWPWDKKKKKLLNLFSLLSKIRKEKYTHVINVHRFASSGSLTAFSGANEKIGFDKNPWSFFFTHKVKHEIGNNKHEVERNQELIIDLTDEIPSKPRLYPSGADFQAISQFQGPYICIAPGSVWFTKTFPEDKWIEFIKLYSSKNPNHKIYLLGSSSERLLCDRIQKKSSVNNTKVLAGELSFLQSAALISKAIRTYVNDSAPLHISSAMNAPVTVIYCSTVPEFGFGPLSDDATIVQLNEKLYCRPCGIHGFNACPEKHFKCALSIDVKELV